MRLVIRFHLDENVDEAVSRGLRARGFDVTMPTEVGLREAEDARHLDFALSEERVLFTHEADFPRLQRIISTGIPLDRSSDHDVSEVFMIDRFEIIDHDSSRPELVGNMWST